MHTPGPWTYDSETGMIESTHADLRGGHEHICDMRPNLKMAYHAANARLIASAPDLLSALKALVEADTDICEDRGAKADQAMGRIAALDMALAAIAKTEGRG